jgi:hypothetical protein
MSEMKEPEKPDPMEGFEDEEEVPLCTGCGRPYRSALYYCDPCGAAVGNLTPYVPYVNIPFNYKPLADLTARVRRGEPVGVLEWVVYFLLAITSFQIILLALPWRPWRAMRARRDRKKDGPGQA